MFKIRFSKNSDFVNLISAETLYPSRGSRLLKRKLSVFAVAFLIVALVIPTYLSFVSSSTGNIRINSKSASTVGQQVQAGGNVNLYFGEITWSSSAFYLFLSQDGLTQISSGDYVYTPAFSIYDVIDTTTVHHYTQDN